MWNPFNYKKKTSSLSFTRAECSSMTGSYTGHRLEGTHAFKLDLTENWQNGKNENIKTVEHFCTTAQNKNIRALRRNTLRNLNDITK